MLAAAAPALAPQAGTTAVEAPAVVPSAPPQAPSGFAGQLSRPVFTLASAGQGEHVMTVRVTPENLGPVTVQAHIGADGIRVELFAPNDAGRAAVQAVLPDLRKDLAGAGIGASLDLSSRNAPQQGGRDGGGDGGGRNGAGGRGGHTASALRADSLRPARAAPLAPGITDTSLDILA
ncbi:MAG: flagellar hook-length control protein FliK [Sinomonas sp.]|nr:flagellar hook-length control protein FliK [Sinomonas sp.]